MTREFVYYRGLNLSEFMSQQELERPPIYDLYGIVNHYGTMIGGHYTSYVRLPQTANPAESEVCKYSLIRQSS